MSVSIDGEDFDEEIQTLIGASTQLADELVAITARDELQHSRSTILKDIETDVDQFSKAIESYRNSLDRLALLENGMLHGLNKTSTIPGNIVKQLDRLEGKIETLREMIRMKITFLPPRTICKDAFATLDNQREQLASMEQEMDQIRSLVDADQARDTALAMSSMQRKMNKLMQDMDSFLKLNACQKTTILGYSKKIFQGNSP